MRKIILGTVLGLVFSIGAYTSAKAEGDVPPTREPQGGWVKVDASGNAISGATVCTYSVCGDPSSLFNKLTLNAGEQWVKQTVADPVTGNVVGIGNNNPGTTVTYDRPSETWTVIIPTPAPTAAPVDTAPQPTSLPESNPQPTSQPQPTAEPTQSPAQPTPTPTQPVVEAPVVPAPTEAPTQAPTPIPQPTVDPSIIGYTFKLSDTVDGNINWKPLRRTWGEPYPI